MLVLGDDRMVNEAYISIAEQVTRYGKEIPSRNGATLELHPYAYQVEHFSNYMLNIPTRVINFPFVLAELIWIMNGDNQSWISHYNKQVLEYADDSSIKIFNAAYGYRMKHEFRYDQFEDVIKFLNQDRYSRQAVINYRSPSQDQFKIDTKDRACNISSMFAIRDNKLDIVQTVRSHDLVWGVPYNWIHFGYITQALAEQLDVKVGSYTEMCNSMHIYQQHAQEMQRLEYGYENREIDEYMQSLEIPSIGNVDYYKLSNVAMSIRNCLRNGGNNLEILGRLLNHIDSHAVNSRFWSGGLRVLLAYEFRRYPNLASACFIDMDYLFKQLTFNYFKTYWSKYWKDYSLDPWYGQPIVK